MIIVDTALAQREAQGNPIRVGMVGAGFQAGGIGLQIMTATPGMRGDCGWATGSHRGCRGTGTRRGIGCNY